MKILLINKFLYRRGGAETVLLDQQRLLEAAGHTVLLFGMEDPLNADSSTKHYYAPAVDYKKKKPVLQTLKDAARAIWSREVAKQLDALIRAERPDIAHVHNFLWQLSASIFPVLKKHNIPVVQTVHDFGPLSANPGLFSKGKRCELPTDIHWYELLYHPCPLETTRKTMVASLSLLIPRWKRVYPHMVDAFVTPGQFMKERLEAGHITQPITVIHNAVDVATVVPNYTPGDYVLYVGRLSPEKGLMTLIRAARKIPQVPVRIVGDGPLADPIKQYIKMKQVRNVTLLGWQTKDQVNEIMSKCRFLVLPTECYENASTVAIEAMGVGKPVLASDSGGNADIVEKNRAGWMFPVGDIKHLRRSLLAIYEDVESIEKAGRAGRAAIEQQYSAAQTLHDLEKLYTSLLDRGSSMG